MTDANLTFLQVPHGIFLPLKNFGSSLFVNADGHIGHAEFSGAENILGLGRR